MSKFEIDNEVERLETVVAAMRKLGVLTYAGIAITPMAPFKAPDNAGNDEEPAKAKHKTLKDLRNG